MSTFPSDIYPIGWHSSEHRVHTEWQRPLSGIHSIMMERLAQAGEGGARPTLFTLFTISRADTPVFHLYPISYALSGSEIGIFRLQNSRKLKWLWRREKTTFQTKRWSANMLSKVSKNIKREHVQYTSLTIMSVLQNSKAAGAITVKIKVKLWKINKLRFA